MLVVQVIGDRNEFLVPPVLSRFLPTDQKDCIPPRIECIKDAIRPTAMLDAELAHVRVTRGDDGGGVGKAKLRTAGLEKDHDRANVLLFRQAQPVPPSSELVGVLDVERHA